MACLRLIVSLAALLTLAACKPREVVVRQTEVRTLRDTLRQHISTRDSIYLHDSIFVLRETIPAAEPSGSDTLRETKLVYRYLYKEKKGKDSVRVINRTDTILVKEPDLSAIKAAEKQVKEEHKTARRWQGRFYALIIAIIGISVFILIRKLKY